MDGPALTDIIECKKLLNIPLDDHSQDYALGYYIQTATDLIGEFLDRPQLYLRSRTEYYNGTGTHKLLVRSRPVYIDPQPQCWVDHAGYWGETENSFQSGTELTYGKDFAVWLDTDDPTGTMTLSRCGIFVRKNDFWPRPQVREQGFLSPYVESQSYGNVKVTYTAGFTLMNMPTQLRMACIFIVSRLKYLFPLGIPISSEGYEERSISLAVGERNWIAGQVKHLIWSFRSWKF